MRLGRITQINTQPKQVELGWQGHVIAENQRRVRETYVKGLRDGIEMTLDHISGKAAGGEPYTGPIPDDLRAYIERSRQAIASLTKDQT